MMHSGLRRIEATLNQLDLEAVSASRSTGMTHLGVCSESLSNRLQGSWQGSIQKSWQGSLATSRSSSGSTLCSTSSSSRSTLDVSCLSSPSKARTIQPFPLSKETESLPMKRFVSPSVACGWAERSPTWSDSESMQITLDTIGNETAANEKTRIGKACHEKVCTEIVQTRGAIAEPYSEAHDSLLEADVALIPDSFAADSFAADSFAADSFVADSTMATSADAWENRGIAIASRILATVRSETVKPFAVGEQYARLSLPKVKETAAQSPVNEQLPHSQGIAKVLKGIAATIAAWQADLAQIVRQIQALYEEGPILEGWLESRSHDFGQLSPSPNTATLRHAEIEDLMAYVESICQDQPMQVIEEPRTDYRLCGLNEEGHLWSRPCPPEQVPYVSLAIARYQKLRTLLADKQELEHRLNQLIQSLTILHGEAQQG